MGRPEWIVALVVAVVYAISAILKARQDANQQVQQQPVRRDPGQQLDRFLQEIDRLRKQQENRGSPSRREDDEEETPTAQRPVVVVRQNRPAPLLPPPPTVLRVVPAPPPPPPPPVASLEPATRTPQVVRPSLAPNVMAVRKTGSNPATTAMQLMRNRRSISAAFVLQEIFSPPKCKRR